MYNDLSAVFLLLYTLFHIAFKIFENALYIIISFAAVSILKTNIL